MNVGIATLYYASFKNVRHVFGFEPFKQTFDKAERNIRMNKNICDKVVASCIALSDREGIEYYDYKEEYPGGMSITEAQSASDSEKKSKIEVCVASKVLEPIISKIADSDCKVMMKIDCEGSEYAILNNMADNRLLEKVNYIVMETHCWRHEEALSILKENGFVVFSKTDRELGIVFAVRE